MEQLHQQNSVKNKIITMLCKVFEICPNVYYYSLYLYICDQDTNARLIEATTAYDTNFKKREAAIEVQFL